MDAAAGRRDASVGVKGIDTEDPESVGAEIVLIHPVLIIS